MPKYFLISILILLSGCMNTNDEVKESEESQETNKTEVKAQAESTGNYDEPIIKDEREAVTPSKLSIPAIDVEAEVEQAGVDEKGRMGVPDGSENVAWFEPGTKPGAAGNSVMAGHVDDTVNPAVFYNLHELKEGDEVSVQNKDGKTLTFEVTGKEVYGFKDAPMEEIFGYTHRSGLNLVTCYGDYVGDTTRREDRLVVYTQLKSESSD
ncbi:class F sortase [Salimicrobium salexigens]|uniref:LPXTG-site transpeptidase (Sortase) family protein n=1 Tax=Salimicrobium salexigens TaxID=908941 RepID=A0ABY1KPN9_9BACI|nr:class F sortase [Salimicrobium salexigens]SIS46961.1 LPXTG-site transpeptidase (sortase) family protein [Salimicrobium salexigens]